MRRTPAPEIVNFRIRWDRIQELALVTGIWVLNLALITLGIASIVANYDH